MFFPRLRIPHKKGSGVLFLLSFLRMTAVVRNWVDRGCNLNWVTTWSYVMAPSMLLPDIFLIPVLNVERWVLWVSVHFYALSTDIAALLIGTESDWEDPTQKRNTTHQRERHSVQNATHWCQQKISDLGISAVRRFMAAISVGALRRPPRHSVTMKGLGGLGEKY